jgi:methionyl-tRNA formyltransferase
MALDEGLDTGPLYRTEEVAIGPDEYADELAARLGVLGARMLVELLAGGLEGLPAPTSQVGVPTYADKLEAHEFELHWEEPAVTLARIVRLGRAWTTWRGRRLRILRARRTASAAEAPPGTLDTSGVATGEGRLEIERVQPESGAAMSYGEWLRGARPAPGERLGNPAP